MGNMLLTMDDRRRITLPKKLVRNKEDKFIAIKTKEGILLKPLPKDPVESLKKEGEKIPEDVNFEDLKKAAEEQAYKEATR